MCPEPHAIQPSRYRKLSDLRTTCRKPESLSITKCIITICIVSFPFVSICGASPFPPRLTIRPDRLRTDRHRLSLPSKTAAVPPDIKELRPQISSAKERSPFQRQEEAAPFSPVRPQTHRPQIRPEGTPQLQRCPSFRSPAGRPRSKVPPHQEQRRTRQIQAIPRAADPAPTSANRFPVPFFPVFFPAF